MTAWNEIIGHEWAVELLRGGIEHGRSGHAYLFTGPEQVGKTLLARVFAQALNCPEANRPCGQCRTCTLIAHNRHPDVRLVLPEVSGRGKWTLKIEAIRALQSDLNLATYEAPTKVAILKRFDAANLNAANAFLKTLEEPPANVVLILTVNEADVLLSTIRSRCRAVNLRPLPTELIEQSLRTRWHVPPNEAKVLARLANGRLGWAVTAYQNPSLLQERQTALQKLYEALNGRRVGRFFLADKLADKPEELPDILRLWLSWWRDVLLLTKGAQEQIVNIDEEAFLRQKAGQWTAVQALTALKQTNLALWQLERNANTKLVIETLFLSYPFG